MARNQFPPHVSSDCANVVWRSWDSVVTAGKNSQLGKEIKATVGAKGKKGPRSESKLKYLLKEQKSSIPEDVVSVFTPGFKGPCDTTKVPDFFLVEKGHKDSPTTETIGALLYTQSTSDNSKYSADAQVGEAIVAGNLFLEQSSEDRQFVYVGITDLRKIRWFKVQRQVATTHQSSETSHVSQSLAGFMYCSLCDLGIMNREITVGAALVEMGRWLGGGLTSNVYFAKIGNEDYAVKVAKDGFDLSADIKYLSTLQGVKGILWIDREKSNTERICMKPVCQKLDRRVLRQRNMRHCLADLVDTLQCAHKHGIVNRDVREENIMISERELVIIDWGFAAPMRNAVHFEGTTHYASERVLNKLQRGLASFEVQASDDLVSLVHTLYGFFEMDEVDKSNLSSLSSEAYASIREFWQVAIPKNSLYLQAHKIATQGHYSDLKRFLLRFVLAL